MTQSTPLLALSEGAFLGIDETWLTVLVPLAIVAALVLLGLLLARLRALEERLKALDRIEDIHKSLSRLAGKQQNQDLRRLEHLFAEL